MNATKKNLAIVLGTAMTATLGAAGALQAADSTFAMQTLSSGYMLAQADKAKEGKCGGASSGKAKDGKCGERKCDKAKDGKCGEGKCGGAKNTQATSKSKDGKCGEGKYGGATK